MTKKWSMVITETDIADWCGAYIPALLRASAEGKIPDTVIFYYINKPAVFIQRYCDVLRDINYEACIKHNIKVTRGLAAGGGVMYNEPGTEPAMTIIWNKDKNPDLPGTIDLILMKFMGTFADVISEKYRIPMRYRPLNDMELWDPKMRVWRKMMGTGASGLFSAVGIGIAPHSTKTTDLIDEVLKVPAEKFSDKVLKDVKTRNWNFQEAGVFPKGLKEIDRIRKDWMEITLQTLKKAFNVEVEEGEMPEIVMQYVSEFKKQFHSEPWIFARSAEKKFQEIPSGTSLGKTFMKVTAGPLIRAYVLREGDTIKDIMFTGTMHMTPADALEKLEKQLIGLKIDENTIRAKVKEWATKDIQIGMLEPSQIAEVVIGACKQSYEKA
ncbi:MAG: hypothetical protein KIH10_09915 [Candidatus Freyarchaeota archaeon]|nr:hypothetical protein [Candidatus Jordarchaeia archaeon]MBS7279389.1 hypothetical protein [Candidatus Jordarchaeia archaeon]